MSEEALAEREHTRTGRIDGFVDGDVAVEMDGHANGNGLPSKKVRLLSDPNIALAEQVLVRLRVLLRASMKLVESWGQ